MVFAVYIEVRSIKEPSPDLDYAGDELMAQTKGSTTLRFKRSAAGDYVGLKYNNTNYYYVKNLQGDVIGIADANGTVKVSYLYDAWGRVLDITGTLASTLGADNPIRYRSYYYDTETGWYFLGSRYYNPEWCRFISADVILGANQDIVSYNLYAYCSFDPVNYCDPTGYRHEIGAGGVGSGDTFQKNNNLKTLIDLFYFFSKVKPKSLPPTGEPGSSQTLPNPDGTPKQKRWYGPDGKAERDRDYNHSGNYPFPHDHEWKDGVRGKDHLPPSSDYQMSVDPLLNVVPSLICTIGIFIIVADDFTGIGILDDALLVPLVFLSCNQLC